MFNKYLGCLAFADDLVLRVPTRGDYTKLVSICEEHTDEYGVKFNSI